MSSIEKRRFTKYTKYTIHNLFALLLGLLGLNHENEVSLQIPVPKTINLQNLSIL